jgi:uncharacterized protein
VLPIWGLWRCTGLMLIGMGLMKAGVLSGMKSRGFYGVLALAGYGFGLPIVVLGAVHSVRGDFDIVGQFLVGMNANYIGSVPVALGHIGVVMLACRSRWGAVLAGTIGAAGRTALTNYLAQTFIGCGLFCGWGMGLFGSLSRADLWLIIVPVWVAQVALSMVWLKRFRFGPAEWVWRSLTYAKAQPLLRP